MESAGPGPGQGRVAGGAGFVRREGGDGDVVHQGKLSDGLGEEEGGGAEVKNEIF